MSHDTQRAVPRPPEQESDTDFGRPPSGHHPDETGEAARVKVQGPDHMREELNPTAAGGPQLNKGQDRREWKRRAEDRARG